MSCKICGLPVGSDREKNCPHIGWEDGEFLETSHRGRGRPKKDGGRDAEFRAKVSPEVLARLDAWAEERNESRGDLLTRLVRERT